jgi:hypothetical protein
LTERRRKKPYQPRWLEGFKQGEYFLQETDPGGRYWNNDNVQYDELRISQSIIVGRAVILAQPMMALPSPATMNPETEASRFSWLLYGTETDLFEIHGGCGFSKKLLHTLSQVTYCAARLQQEPESTIVPITAKFLLRELSTMRQWSREGNDWQEAQKVPQTIDWVREKADDVIIDSNKDMTDVTAEAWRIAAIIYFQCRLLRYETVEKGVNEEGPRRKLKMGRNSHTSFLPALLPLCTALSLTAHHCGGKSKSADPSFILGYLETIRHRDLTSQLKHLYCRYSSWACLRLILGTKRYPRIGLRRLCKRQFVV